MKRNEKALPRELDISRLIIGDIVKGYKGMCEVLNVEPVKNSSTRALQEKDWKRYFEWESLNGGKYRKIVNIKETPDPEPIRSNSLYTPLIEMILVYKLANTPSHEIEKTWPQLYEFLEIVNDRYSSHRYPSTRKMISKEIREVGKASYVDWGFRARSGIKRKVRAALDNMMKRRVILWSEVLYCILDVSEEGGRKEEVHIPAGEKERSVYSEANSYVLSEIYGYDNINEVISAGKYFEFIDSVNEYLHDNYRICGFYNKVRISYNSKFVAKRIEGTKKNLISAANKEGIEVQWDKLNQMFVDMLDHEAHSKNLLAGKKLLGYMAPEDGEREYELPDEFRKYVVYENEDYIIEQELFSQYFIKKGTTVEQLKDKYGKVD